MFARKSLTVKVGIIGMLLFLFLLPMSVHSQDSTPPGVILPESGQSQSASSLPEDADFVPGELIVGLEVDAKGIPSAEGYEETMTTAVAMDVLLVDDAIDGSFYVFKFSSDAALEKNKEAFAKLPGVAYVERNGIMRVPPMPEDRDADKGGREGEDEVGTMAYNPNDTYVDLQWHLDKIMYRMASLNVTTNVPCVVVIDTGVDYTHTDLSGKVYKGKDTIEGDLDPMDVHGHGTHVAGIAAGSTDNSTGIAGVSPESNILAVRVLGDNGFGTHAQVANGIKWANNWATAPKCGGQEPKIYNMSLGSSSPSTAINYAIGAAAAKGRLVVAAAGNSNTTNKHWPAAYPKSFAVAATEQMGKRAYFSNHGSWVDIAAPGYHILSTVMGPGYEYKSGTSMAAPVVAGAAARVWAKYPAYTADQVRSRLVNTAEKTFQDGLVGDIKIINLWAALGGGAYTTINGQIFDAYSSEPLEGATVKVKRTGNTHCTTTTNDVGFYSCKVPDYGMFYVSAAKTGYVTDFRAIAIPASKHRFYANLALGRENGSSSSDDWGVNLYWKGHQPYTRLGKDLDLYTVKLTSPPECSSPFTGSGSDDIYTGTDSAWVTYRQSESIQIDDETGGVVHVWVVNWDYGAYPWQSYIAGSWARVHIYKNNTIVARVRMPFYPKLAAYDNWYVGKIDTTTGTWTTVNTTRPNGGAPSCLVSPGPY